MLALELVVIRRKWVRQGLQAIYKYWGSDQAILLENPANLKSTSNNTTKFQIKVCLFLSEGTYWFSKAKQLHRALVEYQVCVRPQGVTLAVPCLKASSALFLKALGIIKARDFPHTFSGTSLSISGSVHPTEI